MLNRKLSCIFFFIIVFIFFTLSPIKGQVQPRDIIWAHGTTTTTSKGWYDFRNEMIQEGFIFNDILTGPLYNDAVVNGVLSTSNYLDQRVGFQMGENVLGIGHGIGGIALRYAQLANDDISAMVLCGVPNKGSHAILKATNFISGKTEVQLIVEKVESIKLGDSCADCNITGLFKSWVDDLENSESILRDLRPDSDVIVDINKPENSPTIPYITLYGTVEDFSLTRMLDTRGSVSDDDALVRCQEERIREESKNINNLQILRTIKKVNGFLTGVIGFAGSIISAGTSGNPGAALSAVSNYINQQTTTVINDIQAEQEIEEELARMLRCQLANQLQEAEWMLLMLDGSFQETTIYMDVTTQEDIEMCKLLCETDFPNDPNAFHHCQTYCSQYFSVTEPVTVNIFVAELTNGLLAESEQKLAGTNLVAEIHLPNTNHFQMTMRNQEVLVDEFKDNIFSGSLGAAFMVPKN